GQETNRVGVRRFGGLQGVLDRETRGGRAPGYVYRPVGARRDPAAGIGGVTRQTGRVKERASGRADPGHENSARGEKRVDGREISRPRLPGNIAVAGPVDRDRAG